MPGLKFLCVIADRPKADKIAKTASGLGAAYCHIFYGRGTARNEILDLLGLGETEKAVVVATIGADALPGMRRALIDSYGFDKPGSGIAFAIPVTSVGGPATLKLLTGGKEP